jgi:hypothetical protein
VSKILRAPFLLGSHARLVEKVRKSGGARKQWNIMMANGKPAAETVETIFNVVHHKNPNLWNFTNHLIEEMAGKFYTDTTGNSRALRAPPPG